MLVKGIWRSVFWETCIGYCFRGPFLVLCLLGITKLDLKSSLISVHLASYNFRFSCVVGMS